MQGVADVLRARADPCDPTIVLRGVSKRYVVGGTTEVVALAEVDLEVRPGEVVVVLGPSGCGKTTLLNLIGGLDQATDGSIVVEGRELSTLPKSELGTYRRHAVSFVFQSFNLFPGLTALENVQFAADVAGRDSAVELAREALTQVDLADRVAHFPHELSGGEQQRVAIARALASGNRILLADEPTGELDFTTGITILALLVEQARAGSSVLIVTHNREIARIADRVVELSGGHVIGAAPPPDPVAVGDLHW